MRGPASIDIAEYTWQSHVVRNEWKLHEVNAYDPVTGISPRKYHNLMHILDVERYAALVGMHALADGVLSPFEVIDLGTSAVGHDIFHGTSVQGDGFDESISALIVLMRMNRDDVYLLNGLPAERTSLAIPSTVVDLSVHGRIQQAVELQEHKDSKLAPYLCDADLGSFGDRYAVYFSRALNYFRELSADVSDPEELKESVIKFFEANALMLKNHLYHTPQARVVFPNAAQNSDILTDQLKNNRNYFYDLALAA